MVRIHDYSPDQRLDTRREPTMKKILGPLVAMSLLTFASGCKGDEPKAACTPPKVEMTANAQTKWNSLCVTCHGKNGLGDGPAGKNLDPKPRSFASADWQKSVTDESIVAIIVKGSKGVGKSDGMPPNPELEGKKDDLDSLVRKVRSLGACQ